MLSLIKKPGKRQSMTDAPKILTLGIYLIFAENMSVKQLVGNSGWRRYQSACLYVHGWNHVRDCTTFLNNYNNHHHHPVCFGIFGIKYRATTWLIKKKDTLMFWKTSEKPHKRELTHPKESILRKGLFHPFVSFQKDSSPWLWISAWSLFSSV